MLGGTVCRSLIPNLKSEKEYRNYGYKASAFLSTALTAQISWNLQYRITFCRHLLWQVSWQWDANV